MEMTIELFDCTNVLLREIAMIEANQKDIAITYSLALKSTDPTDWKKVNRVIINRWGKSGLERIKKIAWSGRCFTKRPCNSMTNK